MVAAVTGSSQVCAFPRSHTAASRGMLCVEQVSAALPEGTMTDAPWRRAGVRYAANELYIDLLERVDAVVDGATGMLASAEVQHN